MNNFNKKGEKNPNKEKRIIKKRQATTGCSKTCHSNAQCLSLRTGPLCVCNFGYAGKKAIKKQILIRNFKSREKYYNLFFSF